MSRVLNDKSIVRQDTRQAVLKAAESLGYEAHVFARGLAGRKSMTVGVVSREIGCTFYDTVMQGVIRGFVGCPEHTSKQGNGFRVLSRRQVSYFLSENLCSRRFNSCGSLRR